MRHSRTLYEFEDLNFGSPSAGFPTDHDQATAVCDVPRKGVSSGSVGNEDQMVIMPWRGEQYVRDYKVTLQSL